MQAPLRYPELFLAPPERTPESFWISLAYFNLYRVALAIGLLLLLLPAAGRMGGLERTTS